MLTWSSQKASVQSVQRGWPHHNPRNYGKVGLQFVGLDKGGAEHGCAICVYVAIGQSTPEKDAVRSDLHLRMNERQDLMEEATRAARVCNSNDGVGESNHVSVGPQDLVVGSGSIGDPVEIRQQAGDLASGEGVEKMPEAENINEGYDFGLTCLSG